MCKAIHKMLPAGHIPCINATLYINAKYLVDSFTYQNYCQSWYSAY